MQMRALSLLSMLVYVFSETCDRQCEKIVCENGGGDIRSCGCKPPCPRGFPVTGRGFGDSKKTQQSEDLLLLGGTSWWYDWGLSPVFNDTNTEHEFVSMAFGAHDNGVPIEQVLEEWVPHSTSRTLLGFNEPNLGRQSNLTADAACKLWPALKKAAAKHSLKLGSPAANHCKPNGAGSQDSNCHMPPEEWFDSFFSLPGCGVDTVDFVATHKYGCNWTDTVEYVKSLHERYKKPIWLTEFSCGKATPEKQLAFMKNILPAFDAMPEVIPRYAWFVARGGTSKIGDNDGLIEDHNLTMLGQYYNSTHEYT